MKVLALLVTTLAAGCPTKPLSGRCETDSDCAGGEQCAGGVCLSGPIPCSSTQPCPNSESCCGGVCSPTLCCLADLECAGGYCHLGTCRAGPRPACSRVATCPGRCLQTIDQCVECIYSDDCADPTLACSEDHRCLPPGTPCTVASCAALDLVCSPQGDCRACNSTPECGSEWCDAGLCVACSTDPDCGLGRICDAGVCINDPGTPCTGNAECGDLVCNTATSLCEACTSSPQCGNGRACDTGRCVAVTPNCDEDGDCSPPSTICQAGLCSPGCTATSCSPGQQCSPTTGRCVVTSIGNLDLWAECTAHEQCLSNVCWPQGGGEFRCSMTCMRHDDCPTDFVCFEMGDSNLCVDKARLGVPADVPPGGACGTDFVNINCRTGYCKVSRNQCMEMCGREADCADLDPSFTCVSRWPVGTDTDNSGFLEADEVVLFTELCDVPLGALATDMDCLRNGDPSLPVHDRCQSGYCVQTPNYLVEPRCARPCCSPADCPSGRSLCKPIHAWDGTAPSDTSEPYTFLKVCLWREFNGAKEVGELCDADSECKSEICVAGPSAVKRCTHTCCTNRDCANYDWAASCRVAFANADPLTDANVAEIRESLGRFSEFGVRYQAYAPLCMPR